MSLLLDRLFDGVTNGCVYAIMALALVIVFRGSGTINFAQGELALFTTYIAWWLTTLGAPIWAGLIVATVAGLVLGAGIERVLIRPVRRRNDLAVLIVCLGLFTALNALAGLIWNSETKVMPSIFPNGLEDYVGIGGARLYFDGLGVWLVVLLVVGLMFLLFNRTKLGLHMRAVANAPESAALSGVRTGQVLMFGWGVSGAIGAVAGVLITPLSPQQLGLQTMFPILIYASAAALFGGLDSPLGAVVGGLVLGVLQQLIMGYVGFIGDTLPQTAALTIIVAVLVLRPNGLFGTRQLERVLKTLVITRGTWAHRVFVLALLALTVAALFWGSGLAQFRVAQLTSVFIYAIAISGLNLATGYTGLLSIGHSAFFGLGAYTTGVLVMKYNWDPVSTIPPAIVLCFVVGFLIGLPALRIRGLYLALVTLAVGVAFPELVRRFDDLTGGARGLVIRRRLLNPPPWSGFTAAQRDLWLYWLSVVVLGIVLLLVHNLVRSRAGLAMIATRDNEVAAAASGIRVAAVKTSIFGLSGAVTGLAGCLFAMYLAALSPDGSFTLLKSIEFITGLVIGGAATRIGPVIGAFAVVYIPYLTANLNPSNVSQGQLSGVLFGLVLILIIFLMPDGIVGGISRLSGRFVRLQPAPVNTPTPPGPEENNHEASPVPGGRDERDLTARGVQ